VDTFPKPYTNQISVLSSHGKSRTTFTIIVVVVVTVVVAERISSNIIKPTRYDFLENS